MWWLNTSKSGSLFLAFLLAGCSTLAGLDTASGGSSATPAAEIVVTQDDPTSPAGCSPRQVAELIMRFLDAFNRGDQVQLATFFGADFQWYSMTEGSTTDKNDYRHFVAYNRDDLMSYFVRRHAQHERSQLLTVDVGHGEDSTGRSFVNIGYSLTRTADDLRPGWGGPEKLVVGKGAINCKDQTIFVWSMGMSTVNENEPLPQEGGVCPTPASPIPTTTVIACARGE